MEAKVLFSKSFEELRCSWLRMEESGGSSGRREDAAPPWKPSEATAFARFAAAAASPEASPSASANGAAARVSSLHGVKRKSVLACSQPLALLLPHHQIHGKYDEVALLLPHHQIQGIMRKQRVSVAEFPFLFY